MSVQPWVDRRTDDGSLYREVPVSELRAEEDEIMAASLILDDDGRLLPPAKPLLPPIEPYRYPTMPWDRDRLAQLTEPPPIELAELERPMPADWGVIRRAVLKRDDYRCVRCGESRRLEPHHVRPRRQGGSHDLRNLMTLCYACHNYVEPDDD